MIVARIMIAWLNLIGYRYGKVMLERHEERCKQEIIDKERYYRQMAIERLEQYYRQAAEVNE